MDFLKRQTEAHQASKDATAAAIREAQDARRHAGG